MQELLEMDCEARYDFALNVIAEERDIWILVNESKEFLKIYSEEGDFEYLPIWPSEELAKSYRNIEASLVPMSLSVPEFLKKWVPGLTKDGIELGVFPGSDDNIWICEAGEFRDDLQEEMSNF